MVVLLVLVAVEVAWKSFSRREMAWRYAVVMSGGYECSTMSENLRSWVSSGLLVGDGGSVSQVMAVTSLDKGGFLR